MPTQIPWRGAVVEGAVIVGSILLAFGIQAWWDELQEQDRRVEVLTAIRASAEASRDSVQSVITAIERDQAYVARFFATSTSEIDAIPVDKVLPTLSALMRAYAGDVTSGPLIGVTKAADVALVGDPALRGLLEQWDVAMTSLDQIAANSASAEVRAIETLSRDSAFQAFFLGGSAMTALDLRGVHGDSGVRAVVASVVFQRGLYMFVLRRHLAILDDIARAAEAVLSR